MFQVKVIFIVFFMFPRKTSTFTHPTPHTASQYTLSHPLLIISYVFVLLILPCLKIDWANDTRIPYQYLFPALSLPPCNFVPVTWKSPPKNLGDVLYWFLYQVLSIQPYATSNGYNKPCFNKEPIKLLNISYPEITVPYH